MDLKERLFTSRFHQNMLRPCSLSGVIERAKAAEKANMPILMIKIKRRRTRVLLANPIKVLLNHFCQDNQGRLVVLHRETVFKIKTHIYRNRSSQLLHYHLSACLCRRSVSILFAKIIPTVLKWVRMIRLNSSKNFIKNQRMPE